MTVRVERLRPSPAIAVALTAMRQALWPEADRTELAAATPQILARDDHAIFGAVDGEHLVGFLEVGQRDVAEGCSTSPVGYIEALWVEPEARRRGIARALVAAAIGWARERGYRELASDTDLENTLSQAVHERLGFTETERLVTFLMKVG